MLMSQPRKVASEGPPKSYLEMIKEFNPSLTDVERQKAVAELRKDRSRQTSAGSRLSEQR